MSSLIARLLAFWDLKRRWTCARTRAQREDHAHAHGGIIHHGPAKVFGLERKITRGEMADLTLFSTDHEWTYNVKESSSKSRNSPFDGRSFKGAPMATIVAGRVVWKR